MAYSNGRIYRELSSGKIIGVSINDVQRALGVGINNVGGLCVSDKINMWAKFRPIPCANYSLNSPRPLTRANRITERYGIEPPVDMFTADSIQQYENYANQLSEKGLYYIKSRPWGDTHFKRIDDFAENASYNVGYDHNAKPDNKKVTISSGQSYQVGEHYLAPLIPEEQRTITIPNGSTAARYKFPVDHTWMDVYYQYVYGTTSLVVEVDGNDEWLSPMDLMGTSTYSMSYASVIRRILIFRWADSQDRIEGDSGYNPYDAQWRFFNYATDKIQSSSSVWNSNDRPFSSYPQAWLDLTSSETAVNTYYDSSTMPSHRMKELKGRCLFIDCWLQSNSSVNLMPIVGYAYEVNIYRTNDDIGIDITNTFIFALVKSYTSSSGTDYVLEYDYNPVNFPVPAQDYAQSLVVAQWQTYFDSLSISFSGTSVNLLNTGLEHYTQNTSSRVLNWFSGECVLAEGRSGAVGTTATITGLRKRSGGQSSVSVTKTIQIVAG